MRVDVVLVSKMKKREANQVFASFQNSRAGLNSNLS